MATRSLSQGPHEHISLLLCEGRRVAKAEGGEDAAPRRSSARLKGVNAQETLGEDFSTRNPYYFNYGIFGTVLPDLLKRQIERENRVRRA